MSFKLKSLTCKNFVVFVDETTVDFSNKSLNMIEATFLNDPLQSNGAGKSTLLCGISLALFGKGIRFNHLSDYIAPTNPAGGIYLGLMMEDPLTGDQLFVERWRRPGSDANKAKVWVNSKCISMDMTISKIDELLISRVGITHSNFLSCIFSVMLPGFLALRPAQRFEVLENALAVKKVETIIKKLNTSLKTCEDRLVETNNVLTDKHHMFGQETAKREIYSQNIDSLKSSIKQQEEEKLGLYSQEQSMLTKKDELLDMQTELDTKLTALKKKYNSAEALRDALGASKTKLINTIKALDKSFKSVGDSEVECVVCHSTLSSSSKSSIEDHYRDELKALTDEVTTTTSLITKLGLDLSGLEKHQVALKKALNSVTSELLIISSSAHSCEKTIKTAQANLTMAESAFDAAVSDALEAEIKSLTKQKTDLQKESKIITAWKQAMSKNGLRLAYLREEVGTLSAIATRYASSVYSKPTKVEFFINEERDTPQLDFTVNGTPASTFSTGERRLLEIAITLSLMALLRTAGMNLEFLILDECLDGLSQRNKANMVKIISDLAQDNQIVLISHDDVLKNQPGNVICVNKDNTTNTSTIHQYTR